MTDTPPPDPRAAIAVWWRHANRGAKQKARDAGYYTGAPLPPDLVASLSLAGVDLVDAHVVAPSGGRRGYYLPEESSRALRALDRPEEEPLRPPRRDR